VSDIAAELARVRDVFNKPTLRLLARKWAPLVIAVFRTAFTRDQRTIPADRLHQQVDNYLDELRLVGKPVPEGTGRALCMQWLGDNWLIRTRDGDGNEHYSLVPGDELRRVAGELEPFGNFADPTVVVHLQRHFGISFATMRVRLMQERLRLFERTACSRSSRVRLSVLSWRTRCLSVVFSVVIRCAASRDHSCSRSRIWPMRAAIRSRWARPSA
jgi:hypothetical protein